MQDIMVAKQEKDFIFMNKLSLFFSIALSVFLSSCKDNNNDGNTSFFPDVQVQVYVDLNLPPYSTDLALPQSYVYLPEGYRGIVLYRTINDEFVAFDRTCPNNTSNTAAYISVDSSSFYFTCGECSSQFDVNMGAVVKGSAKRGLKQYFIRRSGSVIHISNTP